MFESNSADSLVSPRYRSHIRSYFVAFLAAAVLFVTLFPSSATENFTPTIASSVEASVQTGGFSFRQLKTQTFAWPTSGPVTSLMDDSHPLGIDIGLAHDPYAPIVATGS